MKTVQNKNESDKNESNDEDERDEVTCNRASAHTTIRSTYALIQHQSGTLRRTNVAFSKKASVTTASSLVGNISVLTLRWNSA